MTNEKKDSKEASFVQVPVQMGIGVKLEDERIVSIEECVLQTYNDLLRLKKELGVK